MDLFLNEARLKKVKVTVRLQNNVEPVVGVIAGFEKFSILIESEDEQRLIFKHAIAEIVPTKKLSLKVPQKTDQKPKNEPEKAPANGKGTLSLKK